jgi:hypothetical protein
VARKMSTVWRRVATLVVARKMSTVWRRVATGGGQKSGALLGAIRWFDRSHRHGEKCC